MSIQQKIAAALAQLGGAAAFNHPYEAGDPARCTFYTLQMPASTPTAGLIEGRYPYWSHRPTAASWRLGDPGGRRSPRWRARSARRSDRAHTRACCCSWVGRPRTAPSHSRLSAASWPHHGPVSPAPTPAASTSPPGLARRSRDSWRRHRGGRDGRPGAARGYPYGPAHSGIGAAGDGPGDRGCGGRARRAGRDGGVTACGKGLGCGGALNARAPLNSRANRLVWSA